MPAVNGPAAPFTVERKSGWKSPRFLVFAALAAAIFIFDAYLYNQIHSPPSPPPPVTFRNMHHSVIHASSGFQNLISTVFWISGLCVLFCGCRMIYGVWRRTKDNPAFAPHSERILLFFLFGIGLMAYPFVNAMFGHSYGDYYGNHYSDPYYRSYYGETRAETAARATLKSFALCSWYSAAIAFFFGSFALKRAQRLKDAPDAQGMKDKAAFRFLAGFTLTALPIACASLIGVELW